MKKRAFILLLALAVALMSVSAFAHSGRTDSKGGHHVGGTSEYHYHHGHPAHNHPNGVCPYESKSSSAAAAAFKSDKSSDSSPILDFLGLWFTYAGLAVFALAVLYSPVKSLLRWLRKKWKDFFNG